MPIRVAEKSVVFGCKLNIACYQSVSDKYLYHCISYGVQYVERYHTILRFEKNLVSNNLLLN